jgi:hypothetical protein
MARALGLRAEPSRIHWAIVEGTRDEPVYIGHDAFAAPVNLEEAPALSWYVTRVKHLLDSFTPDVAAIRTAEPIARGNGNSTRRRIRIEGVLLQTVDSCGIKVSLGALAMISGRLGTPAKKYVDAGEFRGLNISKFPTYSKEAILVAVAALP